MASAVEMLARMDELAAAMPLRMRRYAENLLQVGDGKAFATQADAYRNAGYKLADGAKAAGNPGKQAADPRIQEYLDLAGKIATRRAVEALEYDEAQWLWDTVAGLNMALGREAMVATEEVEARDAEGNPIVEIRVHHYRQTKLPAAARYSELLGKRLGILTEKKLHGEDPDKPLNSIKALADLMREIAKDAQQAGPIRNG